MGAYTRFKVFGYEEPCCCFVHFVTLHNAARYVSISTSLWVDGRVILLLMK
jgi:hypothetical protein